MRANIRRSLGTCFHTQSVYLLRECACGRDSKQKYVRTTRSYDMDLTAGIENCTLADIGVAQMTEKEQMGLKEREIGLIKKRWV